MTVEPPLSPRTGRVKAARRLSSRAARTRKRRFVAEGPRAVREALAAPDAVVEVLATATATERHPDLHGAATAAGVPWTRVGAEVVAAVSGTVHPQGLVAVCRFVDLPTASALSGQPRLVAVAVAVGEPGNVGTLIRCADAAGADAVVVTGNGVDPFNPKAVRASAGSLFHLPIAVEPDPRAVVEACRAAGLVVLAADPAATVDLDAAEASALLAAPSAWLFGNEAHGLSDALIELADHAVAVPLHGRAESLNLAAAAAVCLYASARAQRAPDRRVD
ncbi:MAG: RNA methyltransferase [Nocardioidaceae bacterium]|nr:RNA methyltransferase [Nocardioidaceae bacterium]